MVLALVLLGGGALAQGWEAQLPVWVIIWGFTALVVVICLIRAGAAMRGLVLRSVGVFVPLALLLAAIVVTILSASALSERLQAALIAGTLVAGGWLVTFLVNGYRHEREAERRAQDTLYALQSEIFALVDKLDNQDIDATAVQTQARILDGEGQDAWGRAREYHPFATTESTPIVFEAVAGNIPSLAPRTVKAVLRFYAEYTDLRTLVTDSRSDTARALSRERRTALHEQLTKRRKSALRHGLKAVAKINGDLGAKNPGNIQRSGLNPSVPNPIVRAQR